MCSVPDDGFLQLWLGVVDHVLQNPPQGDGDGEEHEHAGDEPSFTVSPNLQEQDRVRPDQNWVRSGRWRWRSFHLVLLQLPDAQRHHGRQQNRVQDQNQRADPPPPLSTGAGHDGCFTLSADLQARPSQTLEQAALGQRHVNL